MRELRFFLLGVPPPLQLIRLCSRAQEESNGGGDQQDFLQKRRIAATELWALLPPFFSKLSENSLGVECKSKKDGRGVDSRWWFHEFR